MIEFILDNRWVLIPVGIVWVGLMFSVKALIIGWMASQDPPAELVEEHRALARAAQAGNAPDSSDEAEAS